MIINFFRKKRVDKPRSLVCQGLTEVNDCSLVVELRQLQKELDETNQRIEQLSSDSFDIQELKKILSHPAMYTLTIDIYYQCCVINQVKYLREILSNITDFDKLIEELKKIYDSQALLVQEHNTATELSNKISKIKQQLGIK